MTISKLRGDVGGRVKRGRPPIGQTPSEKDLIRLYVREERSVRDVAATMGMTKDRVHRALKALRISVRSNASRSKLRTIPLPELEAAVKNKGLRGAARDLEVDHSTLRHHLKVRIGQ